MGRARAWAALILFDVGLGACMPDGDAAGTDVLPDTDQAHGAGVVRWGAEVAVTALHTLRDRMALDARFVTSAGTRSLPREVAPADAIYGYAIAGDDRGTVVAWKEHDNTVRARLFAADGSEVGAYTLWGGAHASLVAAVQGPVAFVAWITEDGRIELARLDRVAGVVIDEGSTVALGGVEQRWWELAMASGPEGGLLCAAAGDGWITGDSPFALAATRFSAEAGIEDLEGIPLGDRIGTDTWSLASAPVGDRFLIRLVPVRSGGSPYDYEQPRDVYVDAEGTVDAVPSPLPPGLRALAADGERFLLIGRVDDEMSLAVLEPDADAPPELRPFLPTVPLERIVGVGRPDHGFLVAWAEGYSRVLAERIDPTGLALDPSPLVIAGD